MAMGMTAITIPFRSPDGQPGARRRLRWMAGGCALALSGCTSFSPDGGFTAVEQAARTRLDKEVRWARADPDRALIDQRVAALLAQPLTMDAAVQLALFNNRGLQAAFFELGISEADLVQAGTVPNPGFTFARLRRDDEVELERGLHLNLARLLAMPLLQDVATRRFAQAQGVAALAVLSLAADTRKAWVLAVAAEESVRYSSQVMQAAQASAELARRMAQVGNFNKLQQGREQAFYADAALNLARAQQARQATRERLTRLLGLWGGQTAFRLPDRLPDLPARPKDLPDIERVALAQRLDVQGERLAVAQPARHLGPPPTPPLAHAPRPGVGPRPPPRGPGPPAPPGGGGGGWAGGGGGAWGGAVGGGRVAGGAAVFGGAAGGGGGGLA